MIYDLLLFFIINFNIIYIFDFYIKSYYSIQEIIFLNTFCNYINSFTHSKSKDKLALYSTFNVTILNFLIAYYDMVIIKVLSFKDLLLLKSFKFIFYTKNSNKTYIIINYVFSIYSILYILLYKFNESIHYIIKLLILEILYFYKQNDITIKYNTDINSLLSSIEINKLCMLFILNNSSINHIFFSFYSILFLSLRFIKFRIGENITNYFSVYDKLSLFYYISITQCLLNQVHFNLLYDKTTISFINLTIFDAYNYILNIL